MQISDKLRLIREHRKMSQGQLARLANIPQQYIQRIEKRGIPGSIPHYMFKIAEVLGVDVNWLIKNEDQRPLKQVCIEQGGGHSSLMKRSGDFFPYPEKKLPLLNWDEITLWINGEIFIPSQRMLVMSVKKEDDLSAKTYLLEVKDDAMENASIVYSLKEKSIVCVDPEALVVSGCLVVAQIGDSAPMLRKYTESGPEIYLQPLKETYKTFNFNPANGDKILGVVKKAYLEIPVPITG